MDAAEKEDFHLGWEGFRFSDLYQPTRLRELNETFWRFVESRAPDLPARWNAAGDTPLPRPSQSELLIEVAAHLGAFLARLFAIESAANQLRVESRDLNAVFRFKQDFLKGKVFRKECDQPLDDAAFSLLDAQVQQLLSATPEHPDPEIRFARTVLALLDSERDDSPAASNAESPTPGAATAAHHDSRDRAAPSARDLARCICGSPPEEALAGRVAQALETLATWCVQVLADPVRRQRVADWVSFVRPDKIDFEHLVEVTHPRADLPELLAGDDTHLRHRDGFRLTDERMSRKEYLREIDYCIICHPREKDSCSHGFRSGPEVYQLNPLGIPLTGCPLEEKISEMHALRQRGEVIAALAMIMLDNPLCPGTGHRICNDCMKGCIYQKQDPVNIPQAETGVVSDVLELPYGFEIYSLLTRFNPLHRARPYALPYHGADVLVVGLGPAGYTLAHYLANQGFGVVGIDGLKLEPVDDALTGRGRACPAPIRDFSTLKAELDERIVMGFGGVSEYGITVRWDKTFLTVIYLTLLRRSNVRFYGGVRFGGTLDLDDAWRLGFRHVALATGAGKPTVIPMKNNLLRGIRKASDFLMALQLTGAFKRSSLASLQVRLPAVVIGGGLTAIDTATELMAYYPVQVEKALQQHERIVSELGADPLHSGMDREEAAILETFLDHGRAIREERAAAQREERKPNFVALCRAWGGVSIVYRKQLGDSPAYRLNHEEVEKALEEGIHFVEGLAPTEAIADEFGAVAALKCRRGDGTEVVLPARTVCVAAGTTPNTVYEREIPGSFELDGEGRFFRKHRLRPAGEGWELEAIDSPSREAFFLSYRQDGRFVSFYGDNHPDYAGNVVKAMASAKHGATQVARLFRPEIDRAEAGGVPLDKFTALAQQLDERLIPHVVEVRRLTPTIVEVVVRAHFAARKFRPGQFFRLQNYDSRAQVVDRVRLSLEGLALTGAWVDVERDLLGMVVLEMGVSSRLCALLQPGEPVVVMGPTGTPSETPGGKTVLLVGGGLGNAVLFSIGKALRERGSRVLYFAGYRRFEDLFMQEAIEEATDQVVWAVDRGEPIPPRRPQDLTFVGNIVQAMMAYASGQLGGAPQIPFQELDHILAIGSDRMMAAVSEARRGVLQPFLRPDHVAIASINSLMQCMLKEVCGQCLQKHVDPATGKETSPVFSCFNQDQAMDCVDFTNLRQRLKTNGVAEKLANRYLDCLLAKAGC
ncbi:MAG: FAD-dependent oxidoreductase [Planctomycetales bacterium]